MFSKISTNCTYKTQNQWENSLKNNQKIANKFLTITERYVNIVSENKRTQTRTTNRTTEKENKK